MHRAPARGYLPSQESPTLPLFADPLLAWWAPLAAVVYAAVSTLVGDRFPFSRYSMYASTAVRDHGAVPVFLADAEPAPIDAFDRFAGLDPDTLYPKGLACSLEWQVHEAKRWIRGHRAAFGEEPGPVKVAFGFVILRVDAEGRLSEELRLTGEGTAWPAR